MTKNAKPGGLPAKQVPLKSRSFTLAAIPATLLLISISIIPQAKTLPAKPLKADAVKVSEAVKAKKTAKAGLKNGCLPEVGTEAYRQLMSPTSQTAPPPPVKRVGFFVEAEGQWCWKSTCEHIEWVCSQGVEEDVNGCCVRCCWENDPSNCSESRCCSARLEQ